MRGWRVKASLFRGSVRCGWGLAERRFVHGDVIAGAQTFIDATVGFLPAFVVEIPQHFRPHLVERHRRRRSARFHEHQVQAITRRQRSVPFARRLLCQIRGEVRPEERGDFARLAVVELEAMQERVAQRVVGGALAQGRERFVRRGFATCSAFSLLKYTWRKPMRSGLA